jgi:hypothetical protein
MLLMAVCMFASVATAFAKEHIIMKSTGEHVSIVVNYLSVIEKIDWVDGSVSDGRDFKEYYLVSIGDYKWSTKYYYHHYTNNNSHTIVITDSGNLEVRKL